MRTPAVAVTVTGFAVIALLSLSGCATNSKTRTSASQPSPRCEAGFNHGWRFAKGDPPGIGDGLSYSRIKPWMLPTSAAFTTNALPARPAGNPGAGVAYVQSEFDDRDWRTLDLPHDWGIEGPFNPDYPHETGKLPYWGVGWYRKHFFVPENDRGRQFYLDVDGAMSFANVWLNCQYVGGWPYGYSSWRQDLTPHIRFGATNVIAIRLDNPPDSSRWYPGGGIYRNVRLVRTGPVHVAQWGVTITTPKITKEAAEVAIQVTVDNRFNTSQAAKVRTIVYPLNAQGIPAKRPVATSDEASLTVPADSSGMADLTARIQKPKLWSPGEPNLYLARTTVTVGRTVVDECETVFGIRTIRFDAANGFFLNGKPFEIQGVCLHDDLGALGMAFSYRARERQLELLKELGCNAVRTAHNPPSPELLDLCDRMGFLVMVEAFDAWRMAKRTNDYHVLFDNWHEQDLRAMIRRDRNHPSVVMWSLGNEVYEQREGTNAWLVAYLAAIAHQEDPTRPVNMALHVVAASTNGFQNALDVFGYNYTPFGYAAFQTNNPNQPLIGSETSSCVSSRGEYFFPVSTNRRDGRANFQITSYDYAAPSWAMAPDVEFKAQDENPFVAGEFVWTGFDYLGEPTPFDRDATNRLIFTEPGVQAEKDRELKEQGRIKVPSRSSYFGILDLCGFKKDRFYLYQARWRPDFPMAHILPHWNWPERVGQITPVYVYTSGDEAELFLNGESLGRRKKGPFEYRLRWDDVRYEPGELKAITYKNGRRWAEDTVATSGPAARLNVETDRKQIFADDADLAFLTVSVTDKDGRLVPRANNLIRFEISGPGEIVAVDNGDATSHSPFQSDKVAAYNGMALVIVRAKRGEVGVITVTARAEGLADGSVAIRTRSP